MNDSYGDGHCCGYGAGYYKLYIDGELAHEGAEFQYTDTFDFSISDTTLPTTAPTPCTTTTGKILEVLLLTDRWPDETFLELTDMTTGALLRREPGFSSCTEYQVLICLPSGIYRFFI